MGAERTPFSGIAFAGQVEYIDPDRRYAMVAFGNGTIRCIPQRDTSMGEPKIGDTVLVYGHMEQDEQGAYLDMEAMQSVGSWILSPRADSWLVR